jgi:hypothetical protein
MKYNEFDSPREKPQVRPVTTMDPKEFDDRIEKAKAKAYKKPEGPDLSKLWNKEKLATEDGMTSADVDRVKNQHFTDRQIKQAYRVLNHPSVKGGNYTAAYNIINRIAPGLADHPDVANALKRANEGFIGKKTEYNDFLQNKLDTAIQEYDTPEKKAERDALMQKYLNKGGKIEKVPTGKTAYKGKELKPAYKKDTAGTPITSPMSDESVEEAPMVAKQQGFDTEKPSSSIPLGTQKVIATMRSLGIPSSQNLDLFIQDIFNKMNQNRVLQIVNSFKKDQTYAKTTPAYDESVQEDINEKGRIVLEKAGFDPNAIHEYMAVFNDHGDTSELEDMNRNKIGVADAMAMVLASHDVQNESAIKEDGPPFGSGMALLRMAIMRKFITVQEWDLLKHKWNDAADEVEQKYADWPEGEGFGSSDHNFAIRDLMSAVGYEFDDQDTSGRFVVIKQPEEIEKAGIRNARMKGEPVKAEAGLGDIGRGLKKGAGAVAKGIGTVAKGAGKLAGAAAKGTAQGAWAGLKSKNIEKGVAQRATQMRNVIGQKSGSGQVVAKGISQMAQGERMTPAAMKQIAPYAIQLQKIMSDPQLAMKFKQLIQIANKRQTMGQPGQAGQPVTADINEDPHAVGQDESVDEGGMPSSIIKHKQKLAHMSDEELADRFKDFDEQRLRQMAWRHGYGKMSSHYLDRVRNHMTSKRTGTYESKLTTMLNQRLK